jgi:protein gp37
VAARFSGLDPNGRPLPYHGLAVMTDKGPRWTRKVVMVPDHLAVPIHWRKPRLIFVNSMSDLFHESISDEDIAAVFGVMGACPRHTFQILTKRSKRMRQWMQWIMKRPGGLLGMPYSPNMVCAGLAQQQTGLRWEVPMEWPLPNVWLGVSCENQEYAEERIPDLLATEAAVHFVSHEPALGGIRYREEWMVGAFDSCADERHDLPGTPESKATDECRGCPGYTLEGGDYCGAVHGPHLDWVIVGGESGHEARPFDVDWARSDVLQCAQYGVACFVKQMGARPMVAASDQPLAISRSPLRLDDAKGANWEEWPKELRVRQYPKKKAAMVAMAAV